MKIIIVGAGIAGLSSYIFLRKQFPDCTIAIYEHYDVQGLSAANGSDRKINHPIGAAIGLGANGLAVLRRMDDGTNLKNMKSLGSCISRWKMGTARGWNIADANVVREGDTMGSIMIARQVAWQVLLDAVLKQDPNAIVRQKVVKISISQFKHIEIDLDSGQQDVCDLLVGADGIKSVVRQHMFSDIHEPQGWMDWLFNRPAKDYITPQYVGLTGLGGFAPASVLDDTDYEPGTMNITFGPNGFFGHGNVGSSNKAASDNQQHLVGWWSTFSSTEPRPYHSSDKVLDRERAFAELRSRHALWKCPSIHAILDNLDPSSIINVYPTYTTPELPFWHRDGIVLVGDAAHALQPSSGQGACQALEDAETLSLLLGHHMTQDKQQDAHQAIEHALTDYEKVRMPRVAKIYKQSQKMSRNKMDMGPVMEWFMYGALWMVAKVRLMDKYNKELFEYDVPKAVLDQIHARRNLDDAGAK